MKRLRILNKKEIKEILDLIKQQWAADINVDFVFLLNEKNNDIFVAERDIFKVDFEQLNVDSLGLYFGEMKKGNLRLSIEGSQLVGPAAKKNVVELDKGETTLWFRGFDLEKKLSEKEAQGYVLVKHNNRFMGTGRIKENRILNFTPKARRVQACH